MVLPPVGGRLAVRKLSSRVVLHRTQGREEKWRVFAPREKRGRAFLRKVGREGAGRTARGSRRLRSTREIHKERRRVPLGPVRARV